MKAYLRLLYAINILIYTFYFFHQGKYESQSILGILSLKENTSLVIETHKCRDKRNRKFCFCRHTEVENRKGEINNNNNKKIATSIWAKIHVYITQLSKHKKEILTKGVKGIFFEKLLKQGCCRNSFISPLEDLFTTILGMRLILNKTQSHLRCAQYQNL